ncbi:MAG: hypothetical protein ACXWC2_05975 [Ramlibacter sp.]
MTRTIASVLLLATLSAVLPALAQGPASGSTEPPVPAAPAASAAAAGDPPAAGVVAVAGLWCGSGPLHEFSLRLTQRQQDVEGELVRRDRVRRIEGRIEGNVLRTQATKVGALVLERQGDQLKVTDGDGPLALVRGQVFRRSASGACTG